jgi:CheY-specific phosphatase CheX
MTDEEADALDELYTRTIPKMATTGQGGFFTERRDRTFVLDAATARIVKAKAQAIHQTPEELLAALVRKDLALAD